MRALKILALIALAMPMLTACDDDDPDTNRARALSGEWYGDFGMSYSYEFRGMMYTFDSYDTDIRFYPEYTNASHGTGIQIDYYARGPYEYMYYSFDWYVRDSQLYLNYLANPELDTCISEYELNNDFFRGWFDGTNVYFELEKETDFYDLNGFIYEDHYRYTPRDNWDYRYNTNPWIGSAAGDKTIHDIKVTSFKRDTKAK